MASKTDTRTETEKALVEFKQGLNFPETFVIKTGDDFVDAGETLKELKARQKRLDELKKGATRPIDEAKRAILALFAEPEARLRTIEVRLKAAIGAYNVKLEAFRRETEAKLRDQQRREQERLLARAARAAEQGNTDKAADLEERAESLPVPIVVMDQEKVAGISTRTVWHAEAIDLLALVKAVAAGEQPLVYLDSNNMALNNAARSLKGQVNIPGVRVWSEQTVVAGSR